MFFVGFAGTIIPYILFTCVMVILTLGANTEVLKKLTAAQEPTKEIVLETSDANNNSQIAIDTQTSFHWANQIDLQLSNDLNSTKPSVVPPLPEFHIKPIFPPALPHYTSGYCALYFGLSPPQLV